MIRPKIFTLLFSLFYIPTLILGAVDQTNLTMKYCSNSLNTEEYKQFRYLVANNFNQVIEQLGTLKYTSNHKLTTEQIRTAIKFVQQSRVKSYKASSHGIQLQWYITVNDGDKLFVQPVISKIDTDSAAFKAGLREGDLITSIDGYTPTGHNCIYQAHSLLRLASSVNDLSFNIKRSSQHKIKSNQTKNKALTINFSLKE